MTDRANKPDWIISAVRDICFHIEQCNALFPDVQEYQNIIDEAHAAHCKEDKSQSQESKIVGAQREWFSSDTRRKEK